MKNPAVVLVWGGRATAVGVLLWGYESVENARQNAERDIDAWAIGGGLGLICSGAAAFRYWVGSYL